MLNVDGRDLVFAAVWFGNIILSSGLLDDVHNICSPLFEAPSVLAVGGGHVVCCRRKVWYYAG
jgi:hypothetical protein